MLKTAKFQAGDVWGGLAATTVVLPQTMAFGVALVSLINIGPAQGAPAGLLAASIFCLTTGITGGTTGLISAPTGPGAVFGELAFLIPGPRVADAPALSNTALLVLNREGFRQFVSRPPDVAVKLLLALGKSLVSPGNTASFRMVIADQNSTYFLLHTLMGGHAHKGDPKKRQKGDTKDGQ